MKKSHTPFERTCILGASSWIGFLMAEEICSRYDAGTHCGTFRTFSPAYSSNFLGGQAQGLGDLLRFVDTNNPTTLFNFLRGETPSDLLLHKHLIDYCAKTRCCYVFASSVLALDGYKDKPLHEGLVSRSISEYGQFKGKCENLLQQAIPLNSLILRFASIQGGVPHKLTRNQLFLEKMRDGIPVTVDLGVRQNRLLDMWLVEMILQLVEDGQTGVFHLGTQDSSDEDHFLRRVADAFGWSSELVKPGKQRGVNLTVNTGRITELYGQRFNYFEEQTIQSLLDIPVLQKYIRVSSY